MMRLFFVSLLGFYIAACGGGSQQAPVTNDLVQLENEWMQAMMKRDRPALDRLVAPEFTVTGIQYIDSAAVTRSVWMNNVLQDMTIDSIAFIKSKASTFSDVGIVRAQFYWSGNYGNDRFADTSSFVDTWVKRNNAWLVVSRVITD